MARSDLTGALPTASQLRLAVTGRRSGREISIPVWFVQEGERLYLLPVGGSGSNWYRNVLKTPAIRLAAGGAEASLRAAPITDPGAVGEVVRKFVAKYGAADVDSYYPESRRDVAVEVALA